jgi:hypothetical protein
VYYLGFLLTDLHKYVLNPHHPVIFCLLIIYPHVRKFSANSNELSTSFPQSIIDAKKPLSSYQQWSICAWQRPTLPGPFGPSTIGAGGLNGRVRDGYAWNPSAIATKHASVKQTLPREIRFITRSDNEFLSVLQA